MLPIIGLALIVQVQGKVRHLVAVCLQVEVGARLANDDREAVALVAVGAAAVALLVEVAKGLAQPREQAGACVPAAQHSISKSCTCVMHDWMGGWTIG